MNSALILQFSTEKTKWQLGYGTNDNHNMFIRSTKANFRFQITISSTTANNVPQRNFPMSAKFIKRKLLPRRVSTGILFNAVKQNNGWLNLAQKWQVARDRIAGWEVRNIQMFFKISPVLSVCLSESWNNYCNEILCFEQGIMSQCPLRYITTTHD